MALLTTINDIPLWSTLSEALAWGASRGLSGSHTHNYNGQAGYMAGENHIQAINSNSNIITQQNILTEDGRDTLEEEDEPTGGGASSTGGGINNSKISPLTGEKVPY